MLPNFIQDAKFQLNLFPFSHEIFDQYKYSNPKASPEVLRVFFVMPKAAHSTKPLDVIPMHTNPPPGDATALLLIGTANSISTIRTQNELEDFLASDQVRFN